MSWRNRWPERQPRPNLRKLSAEEKEKCLSTMKRAIDRAPVLLSLCVQAQAARGRFYVKREFISYNGESALEMLGRISPLADLSEYFLLETEWRLAAWSEVKRGNVQNLMKTIADDIRGRFHGLGSLNRFLRKTGGLSQAPVDRIDLAFSYQDSGERCTTQEALYHYFGIPIPVIAEPRQWYLYHRQPIIVEASEDQTRVLVDFVKGGLSGDFSGTALYLIKEGNWAVFTIKPSESKSIASAEAWIKKRHWENWI